VERQRIGQKGYEMTTALRSQDGRVVATLDGDTLRKRVIEAKHKLYKPPAWCIDRIVVEDAVNGGAKRIEIMATDTGRTYRVDMATFLARAENLNREHNDQLMLRLRFWQTGDERQMVML
jgi:hypothetical protein